MSPLPLCFGLSHCSVTSKCASAPVPCAALGGSVHTRCHPLDPRKQWLALSLWLHQMSPAGDRCHVFTLLFSRLQGSWLKGETCGRSQRFPPKSQTRLCRTAQGAAGETGHAPHRLPPLGTPLHPQCDQHGRLCPGRVSPLFACISWVCLSAHRGEARPLWVMFSPRSASRPHVPGQLAGLAGRWEKAQLGPPGAAGAR